MKNENMNFLNVKVHARPICTRLVNALVERAG